MTVYPTYATDLPASRNDIRVQPPTPGHLPYASLIRQKVASGQSFGQRLGAQVEWLAGKPRFVLAEGRRFCLQW